MKNAVTPALAGVFTAVWTLASGPSALASDLAEPPSAPTPARERDQATHESPSTRDDAWRLGVLGGIGFPRPLTIEAMLKVKRVLALGAEGGFLPTLSVSGVDTSVWSLAGDVRVFPFQGAFFVGVRVGYQHLGASTTVNVPSVVSASESVSLDSVYVNPRLGFLWTLRSGFTIGIDAGVQVPLSTSFSTTLPVAVASVVQQNTAVQTLSGVLPTVDLLRIGALF